MHDIKSTSAKNFPSSASQSYLNRWLWLKNG